MKIECAWCGAEARAAAQHPGETQWGEGDWYAPPPGWYVRHIESSDYPDLEHACSIACIDAAKKAKALDFEFCRERNTAQDELRRGMEWAKAWARAEDVANERMTAKHGPNWRARAVAPREKR